MMHENYESFMPSEVIHAFLNTCSHGSVMTSGAEVLSCKCTGEQDCENDAL